MGSGAHPLNPISYTFNNKNYNLILINLHFVYFFVSDFFHSTLFFEIHSYCCM